jgi:hypothetical protein
MKYALRKLAKNPGFTVVALAKLALGIGVNSAAFTVLNRLLLRPLPFRDPDHLVQVWTSSARETYIIFTSNEADVLREMNAFLDSLPGT